MIEHIRNSLQEAQRALEAFLANEQTLSNIQKAAELLVESFEHKGKAFSCGNGGSMCDAMHFAEELTGRYRKNRPGIVAGVTRVLGEANVDIRDITQSIIEDIFTMTMLADTAESKLDFAELQKALAEAGELSGVNVSIQREDVFNFMYRL